MAARSVSLAMLRVAMLSTVNAASADRDALGFRTHGPFGPPPREVVHAEASRAAHYKPHGAAASASAILVWSPSRQTKAVLLVASGQIWATPVELADAVSTTAGKGS